MFQNMNSACCTRWRKAARSSVDDPIIHRFDDKGRIIEVDCMNRDGWRLGDCTIAVFQKLRRKRLIASAGGAPYRITREGLRAVRAQLDNR